MYYDKSFVLNACYGGDILKTTKTYALKGTEQMNCSNLIEKVLQATISGSAPKGLIMDMDKFDWVPGVGLYGIERVREVMDSRAASEYLEAWIKRHRDRALELRTVNSTAPVMMILDFKGNEELDLVKNIADYIIEAAPRLKNGALEHTVTEEGVNFSGQMWADTLFMVCIMLAKLGSRTGEAVYSKEAARQLLLHHRYLKDRQSGLFFHGYSEPLDSHLSAARWARANAWITVSTVEMLELLPEQFEGRSEILCSLRQQIRALAEYQRDDGMFYTVIDRSDGYPETSATAGFAYGVLRGITDGYIDVCYKEIYEKAAQGVISQINSSGEVEGVSGGTPIMDSIEEYHGIEVLPTPYGQGLTLLMLTELYKTEKGCDVKDA